MAFCGSRDDQSAFCFGASALVVVVMLVVAAKDFVAAIWAWAIAWAVALVDARSVVVTVNGGREGCGRHDDRPENQRGHTSRGCKTNTTKHGCVLLHENG
jgi:hypothetical protein